MSIVKYANAYLTDRLYGGPEEGGWWYDTGEPVMSLPFVCEDEECVTDDQSFISAKFDNHARDIALHQLHALCEAAGLAPPELEFFKDRDWVIDHMAFYIEGKPGEFYPQERPHYE